LLVVLTNRLGRIIDRARQLGHHDDATGEYREALMAPTSRHAFAPSAAGELLGISLFTVAALLVCVMISVIFVSAFFYDWDVSRTIASLFVIAVVALIAGLLCFLREVQLATASLPHWAALSSRPTSCLHDRSLHPRCPAARASTSRRRTVSTQQHRAWHIHRHARSSRPTTTTG
jgi:hypothetical protein